LNSSVRTRTSSRQTRFYRVRKLRFRCNPCPLFRGRTHWNVRQRVLNAFCNSGPAASRRQPCDSRPRSGPTRKNFRKPEFSKNNRLPTSQAATFRREHWIISLCVSGVKPSSSPRWSARTLCGRTI